MIRLSIMGGPDLVDADGRPIQRLLQQPKRLALLVYLALAGPGRLRTRDAAIGLFWPESTDESARASLNTAMSKFRRDLGFEAIVVRGASEIGVSADLLWCDAVAFVQLAPEDPAGALELYRDEALSGFFIAAGPEFEQWLDNERRRLASIARSAARRLAEDAVRCGSAEEAGRWTRRFLELAPDDEPAARSAMEWLARVGDRAGALAVYDRLAVQLRRAYGATQPSAETRGLAERIRTTEWATPALGAGIVTLPAPIAVSPPSTEDHPAPGDVVSTASATERGVGEHPAALPPRLVSRSVRNWRLPVTGALVLAVSLVGLGMFHRAEGALGGKRTFVRQPRIIVTPIATLDGSPAARDVAVALTTALVARLSHVPSFDVRTEPLATGAKPGRSNDPAADTGFIVTGSVVPAGRRYRVSVQIANATSGTTFKTATFDQTPGDMLATVDTLATRVSTVVRTTVGRQTRLQRWSTDLGDPHLYAMMQDADADRTRADQLQESGDFAAAAQALRGADATLARMEAVDSRNADVKLTRAKVAKELGMLYLMSPFRAPATGAAYLEAGMREARAAVSLDTTDASRRDALGQLEFIDAITVPLVQGSARLLGRAEADLRAAVTADPTRADAWATLSTILFFRADYSGAYLANERAYAADSYAENTEQILANLSDEAYELGDDAAATRWCDEEQRRFRGEWTGAACALDLLAWTGNPDRRVVPRAWSLAAAGDPPNPLTGQVRPRLRMQVAAVLARVGLRDSARAVAARARAAGKGDPELVELEAGVRLLLGDRREAIALLHRYQADGPSTLGRVRSRRFAALRSEF